MPFYKRRFTQEELAPHIQKFKLFLRTNSSVVQDLTDTNQEGFLLTKDTFDKMKKDDSLYNMYSFLVGANHAYLVPFDYNNVAYFFKESADGPVATVSSTHIRMPKLSHLITLTPHDFFALLRLVSTSKKTPAGDSLSLNPAAAGLQSLEQSTLTQFFTKLRTNYRMNPDYADRKWTVKDCVSRVADLEPTRENQLMAMQYLTAMQNSDLLYFPLETSIDLELEWEQMDDNYCVPRTEKED